MNKQITVDISSDDDERKFGAIMLDSSGYTWVFNEAQTKATFKKLSDEKFIELIDKLQVYGLEYSINYPKKSKGISM